LLRFELAKYWFEYFPIVLIITCFDSIMLWFCRSTSTKPWWQGLIWRPSASF
jgi:hypothetical protein